MGPARVAAGAVAIAAALTLGAGAAAQDRHRIVGTWVPGDRAVPNPLPLRDAARRAVAAAHAAAAPDAPDAAGPVDAADAPDAPDAVDPADAPDPADAAGSRPCAAAGMPALLDTRGAVDITQQGDKVLMRYAEWDAMRTVYTNPRNAPPTQQPSAFGVSFGRWEGETLAIFTTYIAHPYFDRAGTPQSAAVTVLERYTPSADGSRLESKVTVTDAATFTAPVVIAGSMAAAGASGAVPGALSAGATDAAATNASAASAASSAAATALVAGGCVG